MSTSATQPVFAVLPMLGWLTAAAGAMGTVNALVLPRVFGGRPGIVEAAILTALVVFIAGVVCALPLVKARNTAEVATAFFIGMGIRVALALIAAGVLIMGMNLPDVPVAVCLMLCYLPALFIETRFIIRHITALDAWHRAQPKTGGDVDVNPPASTAAGNRSEKLA